MGILITIVPCDVREKLKNGGALEWVEGCSKFEQFDAFTVLPGRCARGWRMLILVIMGDDLARGTLDCRNCNNLRLTRLTTLYEFRLGDLGTRCIY